MHSRVPRSFGPPQIRASLFRVNDAGGVSLRVPVDAVPGGQLSSISANKGVRLALGTGDADECLTPSASGGIKIAFAILSYYFRPGGVDQYFRPEGGTYLRP
jgi:hypothetical protein